MVIHFPPCHCLAAGPSQKLEWRHRKQAWIPQGNRQAGWEPLIWNRPKAGGAGTVGSRSPSPRLQAWTTPDPHLVVRGRHCHVAQAAHRPHSSSQITSKPPSSNSTPSLGLGSVGEKGGPVEGHVPWGSWPSGLLCSSTVACLNHGHPNTQALEARPDSLSSGT